MSPLARITAIAALLASACLPGTEPPSNPGGDVDSESHFLTSCTIDADCPGAMDCICEICTVTCDDDAVCAELAADATCLDVTAAPAADFCGTVAPARDFCGIMCDAANLCAEGRSCRDGLCVAQPPPPPADQDGDGTPDADDNCVAVANPDQRDSDVDGRGDVCDPCPADAANDEDGDGRCADVDNCPTVAHPEQRDIDDDGLGDVCDPCPSDPYNDGDRDGVCDSIDNCPCTANPYSDCDEISGTPVEQCDSDEDGVGDACEGMAPQVAGECEPDVEGRRLVVLPNPVHFGLVQAGSQSSAEVDLLSVGALPVEITDIVWLDDAGGVFAVDTGTLGSLPAAIQPGESASISVTFDPGDASYREGTFRVISNGDPATIDVVVRGDTGSCCPASLITVEEGEEVVPQTVLHLHGASAPQGCDPFVSYRWSVIQPIGSTATFLPDANVQSPTLEADVAGYYGFRLDVRDAEGQLACPTAEHAVYVNPSVGVHVELLWSTPGDPDETDEGAFAGADLDLHLLHLTTDDGAISVEDAREHWFDVDRDVFWFNPAPTWDGTSDATMARDDTDGAGPEVITFTATPSPTVWMIGVHYWKDHGFGPSVATVRVYIDANLVFEVLDVELVEHDLWEVAVLEWPGTAPTALTDGDGDLRITPSFEHPEFPAD